MLEARRRLFLALWPDPALRARLQALLQSELCDTRGRMVPEDNLHLTLAFLGMVEADREACLTQALSQLRVGQFTLCLDCLGYWPRPHIVWMGASQTPVQLSTLVEGIRLALPGCGVKPEARPFKVHLTVMRHARRRMRQRALGPIPWPVSHYCLVESMLQRHGARYQVLRTWPLDPA